MMRQCLSLMPSVHRWRSHLSSYVAVCCIYLLAGLPYMSFAAAQECLPSQMDSKYFIEQEPKKVALVIGNKNYKHLPPIESVQMDGEMMNNRLTELGFDVVYYPDVETVNQFEDVVIPEVRKKLGVYDLVVFYFSGHGFSYGAFHYLAPTSMPLSMRDSELPSYAISVDAFKDLVATYKPALIMFFIDTCRSIGGFVVNNDKGENVISKGPPQNPQNHHLAINSFVCYATDTGDSAEGISQAGQMSIFTQALWDRISTEGEPFSNVFREIADDVLARTSGAQNPGNYDWSKTDPYLKPIPRNFEDQKEIWLAALCTKDTKVIEKFTRRYSVTRHATAARQWLADDIASRYTAASPDAIERAWRPTNENQVSVRRLGIPLAFDRSLEASQEQELSKLSNEELGLVAAGTSPQHSDEAAFSKVALDAHKLVVTTQDVKAQMGPDLAGPTGKLVTIPAGTRLIIKDVTVGTNNRLTVSATTDANEFHFLIKFNAGVVLKPLELGKSVKEIIVYPRTGSASDLVDPAPINTTLLTLRAQGWKITWVSLATARTTDESEEAARTMRLANAEYILKRAGVEGVRITSVSGREDFSGNGVRVRFFGIK